MSSSGWGPGDPGQQGPARGGPPQGPGQQGGWQQPPPPQHPGHPPQAQGGWGPQGSSLPGPAYGAPSGAPDHLGPGQRPPKRPWALIAVALGCVLVLLLVVGGGLAFLVLRQGAGDEEIATANPTQTEGGTETESGTPSETPGGNTSTEATPDPGSDFEVVSPYDVPLGDVEDMWAVMEHNPLVEGTLPTVPECELPDTPISPSDEELQAVLDASSTCLNRIWSGAHSDRGLPWMSPTVVVYTHPDVPSEASCDSGFAADFPRMCNLDNTIYWPSGYGTALDLTDPTNAPGTYLWDLAFLYTNAVTWQSSLAVYYTTMQGMLEEGSDEDRVHEAWRRYNLQMQCIASASSMQVPDGARAPAALRETLTDPRGWNEGDPPRNISPENRAKWLEKGFDSGGDLSVCNTWAAEADEVS